MSEDRKVVIPVVVDGTGAKAGFEDVKQGGRDMAQALQQAAQKAGDAVGKIGEGAAPAAAKFDNATRSIIGSVQRTTALMDAGERGTRKFYEALAVQRGVDVNVLKPYLDQLDAVRSKQAQATAGLQQQSAALNGTAVSAKQLQFALRGVPAQFTDIVTSLASGQRPLQVLIQQGGQLKDMFGGIGPAARALGGYIAGLVNPLTIGAAAVVALAAAAHEGSQELRAFQNAATISGNAIGLSVSQFTLMRDSLVGIAGTKGKAAEVLTEIAKNSQIAGQNVRGIAEAAILMEKATGQSVSKTVADFAKLADEPAKSALELNKQYNFLTAATFAHIKALEEQKKHAEATDAAERALADALRARAAGVVDNVGLMERAWRGLAGAAKAGWDAMLNVGREQSLAERFADVSAQVAKGQRAFDPSAFGGNAEARAQLAQNRDAMQSLFRRMEIEQRNADTTAAGTAANRAAVSAVEALTKANDQYASKQDRLNKALGEYRKHLADLRAIPESERNKEVRALLESKTISRTEAGIRQQFTETTGESGIGAQRAARRIAEEENRRLRASIDSLDFSTPTKLTDAERKVIQIQEELKGSLLGVARANKVKELSAAQAAVQDEKATQLLQQQYDASKKAREEITKQADAVGQQADAIRQQAVSQEAANATFGKSKTAIEEMVLSQLKLQAAEADASDTFDPRYVAGLNAKVAAQERYVNALQRSEAQQIKSRQDEAARVAGEETQTLQLQVSLLGRSQQEREKIIAQRRVELDLAKELAEIDKSGASEVDKEARREQARSTARVKSANAEQKTILDDWQRTTDSINQSLTDALLRGFESGKDFGRNLRDTLKNMFSTMVLKPVIQAVMAPVSGQLASFGQSIMGGGQPPGFVGPPSPFASSGFSIGGFNGSQLGFLGAIAAGGSMLGSTIGQAIGLKGQQMTVASIGGALLGGVPGAILGSLVAPGGGPKTESGFGIGVPTRGDPAASRAIVEAVQAQYKAIAGQLAKDLKVGVFTAQDPAGDALTQVGFEAQLNGRSIESRAGRLGGIENVGRSPAELEAELTDESNRVILKALADTGLPDKIGAYLRQLGDIDKLSGGALTEAVAKLQKAMTERQTLEQQFFDLTHTELQRLTTAREKERAAIDDTNRALYDTVATLTDLRAAEANARGALVTAYERESDALKGVIERNQGFAESLRAVRDGLSLSSGALTPSQRTAQLGSAFQSTLTQAVGGNEKALQGLGDAGKSFVDALRDTARNRVELVSGIARVQAGLTTAASAADGRATVAQQQLDAMTQQLSALGLINTSVLSVGEALGSFLSAQTAIEQEQLRYAAQLAASQSAPDQAAAVVAAAAAAVASVSSPVESADAAWLKFRQSIETGGSFVGGFAAGGFASGVARVGELGPEIVDFQTPGRVYTNEQTRGMFASNAELLPAVRELLQAFRSGSDDRRREAVAMLQQLSVMAAKLKKFDVDGLPPERVTA